MSEKILGTTLAATAAVAFSVAPLVDAYAADDSAQVTCFGINGCQGKSACKTASNVCAGHNSCKGKGFVMKTLADCKKEGGKTKES